MVMGEISSKSATTLATNKTKYNGYEFNAELDINLYESFYRLHDPQIGRFWQLDPKPNEEISLYSAMNNNPVLYADPLGDTSLYFNSQGQQIGVINRGSGVTAIEVGDGYAKLVGMGINAINANKDLSDKEVGAFDALLQSIGTAYNVSSFEKFYNDNQVDAKSFAGKSTKDMKNFKYDGKPMKLKAEVYGDLVLDKGVVTMGTGKTSTGSANMGFFDDIPRAKNSVADIHIHPIAETGRFTYDLITGSITTSRSGSIIAGPSGSDMGHAQFNQGTYRSVVVDLKNVYLYKGPGTPMIVIPRK